jgi:hypothetical protein
MKKIIIKFSLVKESQTITGTKIKEEITKTLSQEDIIIPWCAKIDEISLISC